MGGALDEIHDSTGSTPLTAAASTGREHVAAQLINAKANLEQIDSAGNLPLAVAAAWGHVSVVSLLICSKAMVDHADGHGNTAMLYAAHKGQLGTVQTLLEHDADPNIANSLGITPLVRAVQACNIDMIRLLDAAGGGDGPLDPPPQQRALHAAVVSGRVDVLNALLDMDLNTEAVAGPHLCTALIEAIHAGELTCAAALLESRCSADTRDVQSRTPLMVAASVGFAEACRLLLWFRAATELQDPEGNTALLLALAAGHRAAAMTLVQAGASMKASNHRGTTAVSLANALDGVAKPSCFGIFVGLGCTVEPAVPSANWQMTKGPKRSRPPALTYRKLGNNDLMSPYQSQVSIAPKGTETEILSVLSGGRSVKSGDTLSRFS